MPKSTMEIAHQIEIENLTRKNERMRKMATREGFYHCYFEKCKDSKSNIEAFNAVNDEYFELFGSYRYSDNDSFKKVTKHYHNKKAKK